MTTGHWQYQVVVYQEREKDPPVNIGIWVAIPGNTDEALYFLPDNPHLRRAYGDTRHDQVIKILQRMQISLRTGDFWAWWQEQSPEIHRRLKPRKPRIMVPPIGSWPALLMKRFLEEQDCPSGIHLEGGVE